MNPQAIVGRRSIGLFLAITASSIAASAQRIEAPAPQSVASPDGFESGISSSRVQAVRSAHELLRSAPLPITPIHTAADDQGIAYGVWGGGARYKISFHDGATFVPLLGKDYPHNQPFGWRTHSATIGATQLVTHEPRLSYDDDRAEYDLGGIVEAYDLRAADVEQTFVLAAPVGHGDLVIEGVVSTMLAAPEAPAGHRGLQFRDDAGRHLLSYGAATAVDAAGRRRPMTTSFHDGRIELRLDAAWLADASYPVVVDPVIGPGGQVIGDARDEVDVVVDPDSPIESVWVAFSSWSSFVDRDVYMWRFSSDGALTGNAYSDMTSAWSSQGPSVSYVTGAGRSILLFDRQLSNGNRGMRYHRHAYDDLGANTFVQSIATGGHAWRGDVGGTVQAQSGTQALAVWQQEPNTGNFATTNTSDVYGCRIDLTTGLYTSPFAISNLALTDQERPSVNKLASGASNNTWLVAYQTVNSIQIGTPDDYDVAIREVDMGSNVSAPYYVDAGSTDHKYRPIIEGRFTRYLVAFLASPAAAGAPDLDSGYEIRTARIYWSAGSGAGSEPFGTKVLLSASDSRLELGSVGHDLDTRSHWAVLFGSNVTGNLYLRTLGYRGEPLHDETVLLAGTSTGILGGVCYDQDTRHFVLAYGANGVSSYVTMSRFRPDVISSWTTSGIACSPAQIEWTGSQLIGSELGRVEVTGADAGDLHVLVMATASSAQVLVGIPPIQSGCWLLVPNAGPDFVGLLDVRVGADVAWALPLPEYLAPDIYYFQDFHTTGNGPLQLVSTQRLSLPIGL